MIKNDISRLTVDISTDLHKKLKTMAAIEGRSIKEIISESIESRFIFFSKDECPYSNHEPNEETAKEIREARQGKGLLRAKDAADLIKKLRK